MAKNSLAELLARDPWGKQATNALSTYGKKPEQNFLAKLLAEPIGAVERWGHRGANMRQQGLDLINQSMDVPGPHGLGMAALGAGMIPASPFLSLLPSSQELRDRGRAAGGGDLNQAIGGAIGDLVNIPDPATSATALATLGKAALTAKGLAAAAPILGKSAAVAPLGKVIAETMAGASDGVKAFHGTDAAYADMIRKDGFKIGGLDELNDQHPIPGISTTPSRSAAEYYAGGEDYATNPDRAMGVLELKLAGNKTHYPKIDTVTDRYESETGKKLNNANMQDFLGWAKKNDIRGVHTPGEGGEYRVFDPAHITVVR